MQHTQGLVKSHLPEADLDPVGDSIPTDCSEEDWEANHASVLGIAERIVADCRPPASGSFFCLFCCKKSWSDGLI